MQKKQYDPRRTSKHHNWNYYEMALNVCYLVSELMHHPCNSVYNKQEENKNQQKYHHLRLFMIQLVVPN